MLACVALKYSTGFLEAGASWGRLSSQGKIGNYEVAGIRSSSWRSTIPISQSKEGERPIEAMPGGLPLFILGTSTLG